MNKTHNIHQSSTQNPEPHAQHPQQRLKKKSDSISSFRGAGQLSPKK